MAKPPPAPLVYLDTCIYMHVIKKEAGWWPDALKMLRAADQGFIRLAGSTLLLAEVSSYKDTVDTVERDKVIEQYLLNLNITWIEVDMFVVEAARKLCDPYKLRGADAVHLASAIKLRADYFVSNDPDFRPYPRKIENVEIIRPTVLWNETFEDAEIDKEAAKDPPPA